MALLGILSVAPVRADIVYAERFGIADGKPIMLDEPNFFLTELRSFLAEERR